MGVISLTSTASSTGVTVTSNASANTYGTTYTVLSSSTSAAVTRLYWQARINVTGTNRKFKLQLYTGASSSEVAFGPPIPIRLGSTSRMATGVIPLSLASGTRLTMRCMDDTGSGALNVTVNGHQSHSLVPAGPSSGGDLLSDQGTADGFTTALGDGVTVNAFASTSVIASTAADYNTFVLLLADGSGASSAVDSLLRIKDDGTTIFEAYSKKLSNNDGTYNHIMFHHDVASGSAITAELASSNTTTRTLLVGLQGYNLTASGGSTIITGNDMVNTETFARGATSKIVTVKILDTAGAPKTGLAYNTASFTCYKQVGSSATPTSVSLANMTLGTYTSNGFKEIDATNLPGMYQYCPATLDASADYEVHNFRLPATILDTPFTIKLTASDPRASTVEIGSTSKTAIANEVVEAEITALKTYNRSADTTATIDGPTSGTTSFGVSTDSSYKPIKTL